MENDEFGNITFGETTKLMVGIIGRDAILSVIPNDEQRRAFEKYLTRIYKENEVDFAGLATKEKVNPQSYTKLFFDKLDSDSNIPDIIYDFVDSSTWQLFHSCLSLMPFEKTKAEIVKLLLRRQFFHSIYDHYLPKYGKDKLLDILKSISDLSICGSPRTYQILFEKAAKEMTNGNLNLLLRNITIFGQLNGSTMKNHKKQNFSLNLQKIKRWDNGKKARWESMKQIFNFFRDKKQLPIAYRLITIYFVKNAKKVLDDELHLLTKGEFEKIITGLTTMLIEKRKPEEFYDETYFEEELIAISLHQCFIHIRQVNPDEFNKSINEFEQKSPNSKKFFSSWLNAKMKMTLSKNNNCNDHETMREYYRQAFDKGKYYAGSYMRQFLLEAIVLEKNVALGKKYDETQIKNLNDYYGFGYSLEIFAPDKNSLLKILDEIKHRPLIEQFELIERFCNMWNKPLINKPYFTTEPFLIVYLDQGNNDPIDKNDPYNNMYYMGCYNILIMN